MKFIDLQKQYQLLEKQIQQNIQQVLQHGQFILGPEVLELEQKLAAYVQTDHCIAVGSGTDALQVALMALDIGPGDEVIIPSFTFIATGSMVALLGAKPVFVDIEIDTYNIDPSQVATAITEKTKAIIAVDLYGQCADYTALEAIAAEHNIPIIADCAQSLGAEYKNKMAGSLGTIACTSFYPAKTLGAYGEGGACFTQDAKLAETMRQIRNHGQEGNYNHVRLGINARLETLQAAILLAKFAVFPEELQLRQQVAARYDELLRGAVIIPKIDSANKSAYAIYTIRTKLRDDLREYLAQQDIPTAIHYPKPLHLQPVFKYLGHQPGDFPVAEQLATEVLSLPMHPYLTEQELQTVTMAITEVHNAIAS